MSLYNGGSFGPVSCHYCPEQALTFWTDCLGHGVCGDCWPAVRDSLGRWGDLRGWGRDVSDAERRLPRGEWQGGIPARADEQADSREPTSTLIKV